MEAIKRFRFGKKNTMDMTQGGIAKNILLFALPLLVGNLFQQLYNLVDTWVIGQTGNDEAFAAVGSVGPIINILIGFFLGFSSGAGVIISQYFGAKDEKSASKTVHTGMALTLVMAGVFTVLGVTMTPLVLKMMLGGEASAGEASVFNEAKTYLTIYFSGVISLMIYNMGAGFLRAIGDSQRPFYFLIVAAVTNTVLDLLFVFVFEMGVAGVALATIISQAVSMVLVAAILIFVGIIMFTGDISYTLTDDALLIEADYHADSTVPYERIDSLELRETAPEGLREWGFASARLMMGFFDNEEFGGHTRYSYTGTDAHIVAHCGDDILILSDRETLDLAEFRITQFFPQFLSKIFPTCSITGEFHAKTGNRLIRRPLEIISLKKFIRHIQSSLKWNVVLSMFYSKRSGVSGSFSSGTSFGSS